MQKYFYFIHNNKRHYFNSREKAEAESSLVNGSIIYESDEYAYKTFKYEQEKTSSYNKSHDINQQTVGNSNNQINDVSWLNNSEKLVKSQFRKYHAIQVYHVSSCEYFDNESDQRIIYFKNYYKEKNNKKNYNAVLFYSEALRKVIPINKKIFLCCVPSSKANIRNSICYLIEKFAGGPIIDGSGFIVTKKNRSEKKHGFTFSDEELASTMEVHSNKIPEGYKVLLLDDITNEGQSFSVCKKLIRESGFNGQITCLALGQAAGKFFRTGIADEIKDINFNKIEPINFVPPQDKHKDTYIKLEDPWYSKTETKEKPVEVLEGKSLLNKVKEITESNKADLNFFRACGYVIKSNDGVETVDFVKFNDAYNKALKSEESEIHAEELKFKEVNKKRYLRFNKLIKDLNANEYKEKAKTKLKKIKSTLFKFFKR